MVAEKFQIYSVKITANTFLSQKIGSVYFYSCPPPPPPPLPLRPSKTLSPRFLSLSPRQTGIVNSSQTAFFEDIFS